MYFSFHSDSLRLNTMSPVGKLFNSVTEIEHRIGQVEKKIYHIEQY